MSDLSGLDTLIEAAKAAQNCVDFGHEDCEECAAARCFGELPPQLVVALAEAAKAAHAYRVGVIGLMDETLAAPVPLEESPGYEGSPLHALDAALTAVADALKGDSDA